MNLKKVLMKNSKQILVGTAIFFLIIGVVYIYSLTQVRLSKVQITKAGEINIDGFSLSGNIELVNEGVSPVKINHISYDILYGNSNNILTTGYVVGGVIPAKSLGEYTFSNDIKWEPSSELAQELLKPGNSLSEAVGLVKLANFKVIYFDSPFSK